MSAEVESGSASGIVGIDWVRLKRDYLRWRDELYKRTLELLTRSDSVELAEYNDVGYFHHIPPLYFKEARAEWERSGRIPRWMIVGGFYPGIWTALFSPHNTFSFAPPQVCIIRFYFKKEYYVFDRENPEHVELAEEWEEDGRENPWAKEHDGNGEAFEEKMRDFGYPSHRGFYEDNCFGAVVGYSDYASAVIVLEEAVGRAEFFRI